MAAALPTKPVGTKVSIRIRQLRRMNEIAIVKSGGLKTVSIRIRQLRRMNGFRDARLLLTQAVSIRIRQLRRMNGILKK